MAKQFAVLGSPILQSKSPKIHLAAYGALGFSWEYTSFDVPVSEFSNFFSVNSSRFDGFSITMPLKEAAVRCADQVDQLVTKTETANTLVKKDGQWCAYNTDVFGIVQAVSKADISRLQKILIVGNGATAKSALVAMSQVEVDLDFYVAGRSTDNVRKFCDFAANLGFEVRALSGESEKPDLTISTLPPETFDNVLTRYPFFLPSGTLLDVAYNPWPSQAARFWQNAGLPVVNGVEMLIWQAIGQIRLFANGDPLQALGDEVALAATMLDAAR